MCLFFKNWEWGKKEREEKCSCSPFVHQFLKCKFAGTGSIRMTLTPPTAAKSAHCFLATRDFFAYSIYLTGEVGLRGWRSSVWAAQTLSLPNCWSDCSWILAVGSQLDPPFPVASGTLLSFFFCSVIWNKCFLWIETVWLTCSLT